MNKNGSAMGDWAGGWLLGADGLHSSADGLEWQLAWGRGYPLTALLREPQRLVCATYYGLWQVVGSTPRWQQLHDETLTEVLAIAPSAGDPGVVAVSPYGLAFAQRDESAPRWRSCSAGLSLNERFGSAVLALPDTDRWLVGTEAGVLSYDAVANSWQRSDLMGYPCRALIGAFGAFWAGMDGAGIWCSPDGLCWRRAGAGLDEESVFSLHAAGDRILAGTLRGICSGDGAGRWQRSGPSLLVSALAASGDGPWLAGATPGGLWRSDDVGQHWYQVGDFDTVRVILPPEEKR